MKSSVRRVSASDICFAVVVFAAGTVQVSGDKRIIPFMELWHQHIAQTRIPAALLANPSRLKGPYTLDQLKVAPPSPFGSLLSRTYFGSVFLPGRDTTGGARTVWPKQRAVRVCCTTCMRVVCSLLGPCYLPVRMRQWPNEANTEFQNVKSVYKGDEALPDTDIGF